jgi:F-type H+-transporting ATPase subunit b
MRPVAIRVALSLLLLASIVLFVPAATAQDHQPAAPAAQAEPSSHEPTPPAEHDQAAAAEHGAAKAEEGGEAGNSLHEVEQQMKMSASVKALGKMLGIQDPKTAYWVFWILNAAILAWLLHMFIGRKLPGTFRNRTSAIQRGIEEARKASAEASARLTAIEARLSALDSEIASMRTSAEQEGRAEEERLRAATEEEKRSILASSEQEITAAANVARRDLKNYAAELAVELAEKRIAVTEADDRAILQNFSKNLGNGGSR